MTVNLKEKFKKDIDYQFLLFDLAKEEIRNTPVPDNSSSVVVITKSKEEKEKEEIHNLVDQWYKQRKIQYGLERPTNREFKRHFCTIEKCIKEIYCLNDNGNSSSCPKVYVCNEGGVYHVCKVDSNCKSKYIGRDRMYYCIYSQLMVEQELVSEFDGKAKFDGMGEGNDADEEMSSSSMTTTTVEGKDGIKIYQEMDYNNDFDNLEEELMKAFDEQEEEQDEEHQETKKIEKPKPNSSILSKLKKFKTTMERQKNNGGGDSSLLSTSSNSIKNKINRNKFNHLYRFKKPKIKYTLSIATPTPIPTDVTVKEEEEEEEEESSQPPPLVPIKIPLTKCKQNEIIKLFNHVGRPLFLDELGDDKQRKYIDNLYNDDNEEEQEIEQNKPFSNNNNSFLVPITIYGNEQTNLDSLCSIRRHSLRQSDRIISEVKLIIHDLLFNNTERMKINNFHLSAAKEKAYNEVKRYYKDQFVIELTPPQKGSRRYESSFECNVPYPRIGRPLISVGDDIYDSIIETVKFLPLLKRVQEEMVDFLCSIILDTWFLIISTDYYYSIGSSKFDISKHTISMLYMMKRDFLVDVTTNNGSSNTQEKELLVVFPKNKFLCLMMPRKRDLAKFNSIVYLDGNDKKHIENIGKVKYQRGDATDGKNHIDHAIKSIVDPIRRKRYLLELRNRFEKHKIYWLKDVKTLTTLLNEAISERSKIMR